MSVDKDILLRNFLLIFTFYKVYISQSNSVEVMQRKHIQTLDDLNNVVI